MRFILTVLLGALVSLSAQALPRALHSHRHLPAVPHLDLEMTGYEYRELQKKKNNAVFKSLEKPAQTDPEDATLNKYIAIGQRNLAWVDLINQSRAPENKISLTSAATQQGYPLSAPRLMNYQIVLEGWQILESLLPKNLKDVVFGQGPLTADVPVSDREFIEWLWQVDRAYQLTSRYKLMKPWKNEMTEYAAVDVRGYLALRDDADLDEKLVNWSSQNSVTRRGLASALEKICRNSGETRESCSARLETAIAANQVVEFKNSYFQDAKDNFDSFFAIPKWRSDVTWTAANPNVMEIPFANPHNDAVLHFLKFNIEDEFRWLGWALKLNFIETKSKDTTHVVFEAGTTPHVDDLAGSVITMDANAPLSEYDAQWTIRHEYGHVLGFPDCYVEFFDEELGATISYQLDITNLMCSRRGLLQEKHFNELKRVYYKN